MNKSHTSKDFVLFIDYDGTRDRMSDRYAQELKDKLSAKLGSKVWMILLTRASWAQGLLEIHPELDGVFCCDTKGFITEGAFRSNETSTKIYAAQPLSALLDDNPDSKEFAYLKACQKLNIPTAISSAPLIDFKKSPNINEIVKLAHLAATAQNFDID